MVSNKSSSMPPYCHILLSICLCDVSNGVFATSFAIMDRVIIVDLELRIFIITTVQINKSSVHSPRISKLLVSTSTYGLEMCFPLRFIIFDDCSLLTDNVSSETYDSNFERLISAIKISSVN